jgi:preprotein translocase subunit SecA
LVKGVQGVITEVLHKVFGTANDRELRRLAPIVQLINSLEPKMKKLSDDALRAKTFEFKERIKRGQSLDEILPEAFAVVREASCRTLGERHFDVQIVGGIVLHQGKIAEMATGEGKTLVATLPAYLNALTGRGVHIVTVNDYLARRDRDWMGQIYEFLGLTVGVLYHDISHEERKKAYQADITYGTNSEFGFDYLRDNMCLDLSETVQRGFYYAIVDEVDSILIDEARTPLIISGPVETPSTQQYTELKPIVERLVHSQTLLVNRFLAQAEKLLEEGDEYQAGILMLKAKRGAPKNKRLLKLLKEPKYKKLVERVELDYIRDKMLTQLDEDLYFSIDEKSHIVDLTEKGREFISPNDPNLFVLPDLSEIESDPNISEDEKLRREKEFIQKGERIQNLSQLLRAFSLFEKDVNYVVSDGKVIIVDEFTGRLMPGRRYSDGLHQALEAKEGVKVEQETQTLATITIQNYFRMYEKLAGMTGTAETEAHEFLKIYNLDVVVIPTNEPCIRIDYPDVIYRTKREKYRAIIEEIERLHDEGRPVLVGTVSVEVSELLSRMLPKRIKHSVLNAKRHKEEAEIIAKAGMSKAVTIATNMAGRGTDIKLGPGVVEKGGLHIIGTERHEARRIDRQLRGRAGRQGDPGSSRFYISLEDDLMRLFGSQRIASVMDRLGIEEGQPIEHPLITKAIENAQKKVESHNFDIRKHLLEFDDVMNKQREVIYAQRQRILKGEGLVEDIQEMIQKVVDEIVDLHTDSKSPPSDWDWKGLISTLRNRFSSSFGIRPSEDGIDKDQLKKVIIEKAKEAYFQKEALLTEPLMRHIEKMIMLQVLDEKWREHLLGMDHLREGIGLRGYGQRDPLREYQKEGYEMFLQMIHQIEVETVESLFKIQAIPRETLAQREERKKQKMIFSHGEEDEISRKKEPVRKEKKVGRNEPCPCGSGKKFKKCCGR